MIGGSRRIMARVALGGVLTVLVALVIGLGSAAGVSAQQGDVTLTFGPGRDASQPGTVTFKGMGNETVVTIKIAPGQAGVAQPAHIHAGSCPGVGAIVYPLTSVKDGESTTTVNVALPKLFAGGFAVNVHRGPGTEASIYTACVDIPAQAGSHANASSRGVAPAAAAAPAAVAGKSAAAPKTAQAPVKGPVAAQAPVKGPVNVQAPVKAAASAPVVQAPAKAAAAPAVAPAASAPVVQAPARAAAPASVQAPAAAAPVATTPRLPNTGSGGLLSQESSSSSALVALLSGLAVLTLVGGLLWTRRGAVR